MRTAVILTGALRTITKTIRYLKQNVAFHADAHIFACVQNDTDRPVEEWTAWFHEQLGDQLKNIAWFSLDQYPDWVKHRDRQLQNLLLAETWKGYLRSSGSMIEYFQLQLAYMKMCLHEQMRGSEYEYIVRARTDSIYTKRVDFHWLNWTQEEVSARVEIIQAELVESKIEVTPTNTLRYFMNTIISDDLIPNIERIQAEYGPCPTEAAPPTDLYDYLRNGRYILTLRKNNLYVVRRSLFHLIPSLGTMYGFMRSPYSDEYWFNAECLFRSACFFSCVTIFDYGTEFEERSLEYANTWKEETFFDLDFNPVNSEMLYCVVRR